MSITLTQLRCLAAVHQHGSATAAAASLAISQPAVTRSLQELQADIGQPLFERQGRRLTLTDQGRIILAHAESIVRQDEEASADLARWLRSRHAEVRLAASAVPIVTMIPAAIELVRRTHPGARIRIVEATYPDVIRLFREEAIDLAIGPLADGLQRDGYRVEDIGTMPMRVALPRGHALARSRGLAELRDLPWAVSGSLEASTELFRDAFTRLGLAPPREVLHCESMAATLQFIEQSTHLAGFVSAPLALEARHWGRVALPPIEDPLPSRRLGIFHPSHLSQTAVSRALFSALNLAARRLWQDGAAMLPPHAAATGR